MDRRVAINRLLLGSKLAVLRPTILFLAALLTMSSATAQTTGFVPPESLDLSQSAIPALGPDYNQEAWLVYGYNVNVDGSIVDMEIYSSNGVEAVEQETIDHVNSLKYHPARRNGTPVKSSVGPIVFTWILDIPRVMSDEFNTSYQTAWVHFQAGEFDKAFEIAGDLKNMPGRNAFEEIKFQILAASLASRWNDTTAELAHLERIVDFQSLADKNNFVNPYVDEDQYLLMIERIHAVQLEMNMLGDAEVTLKTIANRAPKSDVAQRATAAQQAAVMRLRDESDTTIAGELNAIYSGGRGYWETRLSRGTFFVSDVKGSIQSLYLVCSSGREQRLRHPSAEPWTIPVGWDKCKVEAAGKPGTRFRLHQLAAGALGNSALMNAPSL